MSTWRWPEPPYYQKKCPKCHKDFFTTDETDVNCLACRYTELKR